jgi:hypothetical protein
MYALPWRMKKLFLYFISGLWAMVSFSQANDPREALLNNQLGVFQVRFQELMLSRDQENYESGNIDAVKLTGAIKQYSLYEEESSALLFYHYTHDTLYSWVIKSGGIRAMDFSIMKPETMLALEAGLKSSMKVDFAEPLLASRSARTLFSDSMPAIFYGQSADISRILFPPAIASALKEVRYLTIVPELNIAALPLYGLQLPGEDKMLIDRFSITIAHSLDEFLERRYGYYYDLKYDLNLEGYQGTELVFTPLHPVIVGNPDFSQCPGFVSLPGAEAEAWLVAKKFKVSPLLGKQATKNEVLSRITKSSFIYLATHGVADPSDPMNKSVIVLAGEGDTCGLWNAKEIQFDHVPQNSLVVLSACQTGLGKVLDAGIIGLGRAFIKAHASNVIMSLWSVGDKSTKDLMDIFTDELFVPQHFFPAENLRQAILKYKAKNPDPADWAAFINMGTPYPPGMLVRMDAE